MGRGTRKQGSDSQKHRQRPGCVRGQVCGDRCFSSSDPVASESLASVGLEPALQKLMRTEQSLAGFSALTSARVAVGGLSSS